MSQSAGASALSLSKRLKKLCTYAVLGSFITNILVPSYAFATADVMQPNDPLRGVGRYRTGIMIRTSSSPLRSPTHPIRSKQFLPEDQLTHDVCSDQASDVASQQADYSDDESEYGSSEAESDVSDVTALDDLWGAPRYAVPDQPNTLRFGGVLLDCSAPGKVTLSPDPQATDDERSKEYFHVFNPYGAAILDKVDQLTKSLYVEALGCEVKTDISVQSLALKLINADGKKGTLTIAEGVKLKAAHASFEGVNIDNRGVLEIQDGELHVGTFTDKANTTTKLPSVTLDQKDAVIKGDVDIKYFTHAKGSSNGQWSIEGQLMIRDGAFQASLEDLKGKFGLGGEWQTSTLYGNKPAWRYENGQLHMDMSVLGMEELKTYGKPALAGILQNHTYVDPVTGQEVSETFIVPTLFNISSNPALMAPGASLASTHGDISLAVSNDLYARGVNVRARHAEEAADIAFLAGGRQTHQGVKMDGATQTYAGLLGGVHVLEDQHVQHYEYREGKRTVQGTITTSIANEYKGKHVVFMTPKGSLIFQNIIVDAKKFVATAPEGMVEFLAGVNAHQRVILEKGGDFFITKLKQTAENMVNYIGCDLDKVGTIEVDAKGAFIQRAQNSAMEWVERIRMMQPGTDVSSVVLQDIHDIQTKEQRGLGAVFGALLGLSINALVPGIGSSFWAGLTKLGAVCSRAAMVCMLSMTSQALAKNNGNLGNALHDLTGDQAFKTMLVAVGTAGITHGVCQALPLPEGAHAVVRHGVPAVIRETTNVSLQALTNRQGGDVGRSVMNVAGDIVQGVAAEGISRAVDSGAIGKTAAVGVHMLNGTGAHLIRGGNIQEAGIVGVATGLAEGAMYACVDPEAVAEKVYQEHPKAADAERQRHFDEEIRAHREMAHITAATVAGAVAESLNPGSGGEVVYASSHSAQLAIDHNFSNLVIGAGLTLHTLKPYHDVYEAAGGGEALGLEIAVNFAGGAVMMKAGSKFVQFAKGRAMQFVKGDRVAKVEKEAEFFRQTKVEDKRTVEALRENAARAEKKPGQLGREGEQAVREVYDIGDKVKIRINDRDRVPDGMKRGTLSEVKNTEKLSLTRQLRDYSEHAEKEKLNFDLYTRPDVQMSEPLKKLIEIGKIIKKDIPQ